MSDTNALILEELIRLRRKVEDLEREIRLIPRTPYVVYRPYTYPTYPTYPPYPTITYTTEVGSGTQQIFNLGDNID